MLEWLKTILGSAYTEEIDKKVSDEIGKGFVARNDFNALSEEKKSLLGQLSERDKQLEELKKVDASALQAEIVRLQGENKQKDEDFQKKLAKVEYEGAVNRYVGSIKFTSDLAKDAFAAKLIAKELKLEDGKLLGADDFLGEMRKQNPTAFEQQQAGGGGFSGKQPHDESGADKNAAVNSAIREALKGE